MAIKEKFITIGTNSKSVYYWERNGYEIPRQIGQKGKLVVKRGTKIIVKVEDLPKTSHEKLTKICDICNNECIKKQPYIEIMKNRVSGDGLDRCFKCSRFKGEATKKKNIPFERTVAHKSPNLIPEWHTTLNSTSPFENFYGSKEIVWWICPVCNSPYDMMIKDRSRDKKPVSCPYCAGRRVNETNCLATTHPNFIKEFDVDRNSELEITIYNITGRSSQIIWWKCLDCNSSYDMVCNNKTGQQKQGCPYCSGMRVNHTNSLRTTNPELVLEWHPTKNTILTPDDVTYGSDKIAWWVCSNCESDYDKSIFQRTSIGGNCPYCHGLRVNHTNSLASKYPELINIWHPTLNGNLTPYNVTSRNNKTVWWIGECGHEWDNTVFATTVNMGKCPNCSGRRVCNDNCLMKTHPSVGEEWHPTLNGELTPMDVTYGSHKYAWWLGKCGHEWEAIIKNRTTLKSECPYCHESKGEKIIEEFLITNSIKHKPQFRCKDCKYKKTLPFDFAVFDKNKRLIVMIEFDGQHHYSPVRFGGMSIEKAEKAFKLMQKKDNIKTNYCLINNIPLIRIAFWDFDNIEEILSNELKKLNIDIAM